MKIVQVIAGYAGGEGAGSVVSAMDAFFRCHGFDTCICNQRLSLHSIDDELFSPGNIVIYHLVMMVDPVLRYLRCGKILAFHNITDPGLISGLGVEEIRMQAALGLCDTGGTASYFDAAIAFSDYSCRVLLEKGWEESRVFVLPILVRFDMLSRPPDMGLLRQYKDGRTNILFAGRVFPNKRQEDVISAFAAYKKYDSTARLFLVGRICSRYYHEKLLEYARRLGVANDVHFTGHVDFEEYLAYYHVAHMFLCMSVHEGFCIPLVEAMHFRLPVVALDRTAVPDTLGGGGILVDSADPPAIADIMHRLMTDDVYLKQILAGEAERLKGLSLERLEKMYMGVLKKCMDIIVARKSTNNAPVEYVMPEMPLPFHMGQGPVSVVIYGMGAAGNRLHDLLRMDGRVRVVALCDQGLGGRGMQSHGLSVEKPVKVFQAYSDAEYIISVQDKAIVVKIALVLHDAGVPGERIHVYDELREEVV